MSDEVDVLLVEDNPADTALVQEAFDRVDAGLRLESRADGEEALGFLRSLAETGTPGPRLVLLDLNLPGVSGLQVLQHIRSNPELLGLPVIVFSSSQSPRDVEDAYRYGANGYVRKAVNFDELVERMRHIHGFWIETVCLPE